MVNAAYSADGWGAFAATVAAVAATLTGLLFVAVSINIQRILQFKNLPARAAATLILFATPLIVGLFVLIPDQATVALGLELLLGGLLVLGIQLVIDLRSERAEPESRSGRIITRTFPAVAGGGCIAIAGISFLTGSGGGLYWLVPATVVTIVFGLENAWVLLVEILR
jgi:hypothetical protein